VMAVMSSVGIVVGVCAGLGFCGGYFLSSANNPFALAVGSFSPFTLMQMLIDPYANAGQNFSANVAEEDISFNRATIFFCGLVAVAGYTLVVWQMYQSMVKNFDMTIRKQSR
jgi:hypothetical protein